jgi:hypothetical protein
MGMPDYHRRPPGTRLSESVPNRPNDFHIPGLLERLEREQSNWRKQWSSKATAPIDKLLAQFEFWNIDSQIKKLTRLCNNGIDTISKRDFRAMKLAGAEYVNACLREHDAQTQAKLAAIALARKNRELAELHHAREVARARLGK